MAPGSGRSCAEADAGPISTMPIATARHSADRRAFEVIERAPNCPSRTIESGPARRVKEDDNRTEPWRVPISIQSEVLRNSARFSRLSPLYGVVFPLSCKELAVPPQALALRSL